MQYIDEKFKECSPEETVERIRGILREQGIEVCERWHESGLEHCYSLTVHAKGGIPSSNGKGITKALARASAYGEFIERLQGGLFLYKFQSIARDPDMSIHNFAPDGKYMTVQELVENGDWMDPILAAYPSPGLTRQAIAEQCRMYACADDGRIWTLPFYSLFEGRHVYLPMAFVDQIFATNGCCVGNARDEAWVHALSEMMERHASLRVLRSGSSAPRIPEEVYGRYRVVSKILSAIRESGDFDVEMLDYSIGNGFPVICTRIINKKNQGYRVNVAADPVLEIAMQRTLTELFQGKSLENFAARHGGRILNQVSDFSAAHNAMNHIETASGLYTADYFANELTCHRTCADFPDNSGKTNAQLLEYCLGLYRALGKPVYVRNFSFLGFPCYRFVVPGFSEAFADRLSQPIPEYAVGDDVCKSFRNPMAASDMDLVWLLNYSSMIRDVIGRYHFFGRLAGVPLASSVNMRLTCITRAYAAYRLGQYGDAIKFAQEYIRSGGCGDADQNYFACVNKLLELRGRGVAEEKIRLILQKFFLPDAVQRLYRSLDSGKTPYDEFLLRCDLAGCGSCAYADLCCYHSAKEMNRRVGKVYGTFQNGQDPSEFRIP